MTVVMLPSWHLLISLSSGILFNVPWRKCLRNFFGPFQLVFCTGNLFFSQFLRFNFCRCFRDRSLQISSVQRYIMKKLDLANENEVIYSDVATLPFCY